LPIRAQRAPPRSDPQQRPHPLDNVASVPAAGEQPAVLAALADYCLSALPEAGA
jgi:hypothetical protein